MVRPDSPVPDGDHEALPQLTSGVNIRELPIGPEEAFVLSRVDGLSTAADIAAATNFAPTDVARMLARLASLGAITFGAARPVSGAPPVRPNPARSGAYRIGPVTETQEPRASHHPAAADESAAAVAEPTEPVDLTLEQQRAVAALHERLATADHYQLLGVEPEADAKVIRAAYYEFVRLFHPDRFFGKKLGSYKPKLTQVFARLTEAYETLNRAQTRADYDRYLSARRRTLEFERQVLDPSAQAAEVAIAMQRIEQAARAESLAAQTSSAPPPSSAPPTSASAPINTSRVQPSLAPESDANARRRALARKLGHSSAPPRTSSAPPASGPASAADELKRRYESRLLRARQEQRDHYLALSEQAAARGELAAAANALRIACSLAPDDATLADRLAELQSRASAELWEAYAQRGKYAAFEGRHAEAAESFERAAAGQPIASHFERAAFHLLEAGGDVRHAAQLARQAVALAPQSAKCRLTLAQAYFAGKLRESGLAELERARALEPDQPQIKEWLQRAKRGEV
jgi:curved DNA-binding protein CbpA